MTVSKNALLFSFLQLTQTGEEKEELPVGMVLETATIAIRKRKFSTSTTAPQSSVLATTSHAQATATLSTSHPTSNCHQVPSRTPSIPPREQQQQQQQRGQQALRNAHPCPLHPPPPHHLPAPATSLSHKALSSLSPPPPVLAPPLTPRPIRNPWLEPVHVLKTHIHYRPRNRLTMTQMCS